MNSQAAMTPRSAVVGNGPPIPYARPEWRIGPTGRTDVPTIADIAISSATQTADANTMRPSPVNRRCASWLRMNRIAGTKKPSWHAETTPDTNHSGASANHAPKLVSK